MAAVDQAFVNFIKICLKKANTLVLFHIKDNLEYMILKLVKDIRDSWSTSS